MEIKIKINGVEYAISTDTHGMTVTYLYIGKDKDGNPKDAQTNIAFYGPGQVDKAIDRIIAEEINRNQEVVNLREFLIKYKEIHQSISAQVEELKQILKQNRK